MNKIKLEIAGITYSQSQTGAYLLILEDKEGKRQLPIVIGPTEAQSIAIAMENIKPPRPLTHDLFKNFCDTFNIHIIEVIITRISNGVFFAHLVCDDGKTQIEIDSRTSDAVSLALRFKSPIYATESVMKTARPVENLPQEEINEDDNPEKPLIEEQESISYKDLNLEELQQILQEAIDNEEFEKASKIRDEIKKRK
jgi:bifunctional DNase/RNase